jgi:poly(rC)-binding protein 2/3/4
MSASPSTLPSTKRPLEDPSSPSGPNDQPEAKRPALDKVVRSEDHKQSEADAKDASITNGDSVVNGKDVGSAIDTQPIQSTASHADRATSQPPQHQTPQDESSWIHIRAVISSQEAATCIGKGGENVSQIRRLSGAKCTVSDYSRGAVERILTVSGPQDAVAKVSFFSPFEAHGTDLCRLLV